MATSGPPTFYRDIKPLFSQWDRIQMIGRFDLWSYADVKGRANSIWLSLQPDPTKPNTGWSLLPFVHIMPAVNAPPPPNPLLPVFIALSEALTGFDDLHTNPDLAQAYLDRLLAGDAAASVKSL